jgi:hypothetical protein
MELDRRAFFASVGGAAALSLMDSEAKADALEHHMMMQFQAAAAIPGTGGTQKFPTVAEIDAQIETRPARRGVGNLFTSVRGNVKKLPPMPEKPTLIDFFNLRFATTRNHCLQSANRAMKTGMTEEVILACLLHDTVQEVMKTDHGWWGAAMYEPYVSEKVSFAIRYHQALRFYPDHAAGYEYPDLYKRMFGEDYVPPKYIQETYEMLKKHKWYMEPRLVTVNDLYAFEPGVNPQLEQFTDIIGRNFKQPKEGLGNDNSPVAHMWRTASHPDSPL